MLIVLAIAIAMIISFTMPTIAYAYATSGTIDAPRYSNGNMIKYIFINGANVSLYYINGNDGFHYAYPIVTPSMPGSGDTGSGCPVRLWDWSTGSIGSFPSTIYPRIGDGVSNSYSNWGPQYTVCAG